MRIVRRYYYNGHRKKDSEYYTLLRLENLLQCQESQADKGFVVYSLRYYDIYKKKYKKYKIYNVEMIFANYIVVRSGFCESAVNTREMGTTNSILVLQYFVCDKSI